MFWYRSPTSCGVTGFRMMNMGEDSFGLNTNTSGQEQSVQENHAINVNIDMRNMENFNKTVLIYFFFSSKIKNHYIAKKKASNCYKKPIGAPFPPVQHLLPLQGAAA